MDSVQTRQISLAEIYGSQSCDSALIVPWAQVTSNNTCSSDIVSKYLWVQLWNSCPENIQFFEGNDTASAWLLLELVFTENITVANGLRSLAPRGVITRDFTAEYSVGVITPRYIVLETTVNITSCNGIVCPVPPQCHGQGQCDPNTGSCVYPILSNGISCNDGNLCTIDDTCNFAVCSGSTKQCNNPPNQCYEAVGNCDPSSGECVYAPKSNGVSCDDGDLCTDADTCQAGVCVGNTKQCFAFDQCHEAGQCDPLTGTCSNPIVNGTQCDDNNKCTISDTCILGVCVGSNIVCDGDQCNFAGKNEYCNRYLTFLQEPVILSLELVT